MPCRVPVDVDRPAAAGPDQVPPVASLHLASVGEADGLNAAGAVGRPEPDQGSAGEFVVFEVGGGLDAGGAVIGFDGADGVGPPSVGEGVAAGEHKLDFTAGGIIPGGPSFDLPDRYRLRA